MSESDSKPSNPNSGGLVEKINVADEIKNSFLDYSMSVIISRALPDVRDGLKPSQRRILYAMNDLGVGPSKKHIKCAKIVGETTSGAWGYRVDHSIALGMLRTDLCDPGTQIEVEIYGERFDATVQDNKPLWDPDNKRLRQ